MGFAIALCAPGMSDAANYAGSWQVTGAMGRPLVETIAPVCVFRQSGNTIGGTCQGAAGVGSAGGGVNGAKITWRWARIATSRAQRNGTLTFFGVLGPAGLSGTFTDSGIPGLVGTFTARRV
jgi:hypothetical protein